jgi:universal stress protein A
MLRFSTILHATDFSPHSENAFQVACSLARDHGGKVIVLHVAESPVVLGGVMTPPPPEDNLAAITEQLRKVQSPDGKIPVAHRLEEGEPVAEILRIAQEAKCDLIVIGTHGRTGLSHLLMGSVAEQVVRKATCPVLVVKTRFPESLP